MAAIRFSIPWLKTEAGKVFTDRLDTRLHSVTSWRGLGALPAPPPSSAFCPSPVQLSGPPCTHTNSPRRVSGARSTSASRVDKPGFGVTLLVGVLTGADGHRRLVCRGVLFDVSKWFQFTFKNKDIFAYFWLQLSPTRPCWSSLYLCEACRGAGVTDWPSGQIWASVYRGWRPCWRFQ